MTATDFATPSPQIPRDGWGRPLVVPVGGGKPVAYTRCTTFVDVLDDKTALDKWKQRKVAQGLSMRPDLLMAISSLDDPDGTGKKEFNRICDQAMEAAQSKAKATIGTALHKFTERLDLGLDIGFVPAEHKEDIEAYRRATAELDVVGVEEFVVVDDLKVAGTFDRLARHRGRLVIADVKTGSIEWGMGRIAMQLAMYAHGQHYNPETHERTPLGDVDLDVALVIHLPAGKGVCDLVPVDIAKGWAAVPLAQQIRTWRQAKWPTTPLDTSLALRITQAPTIEALTALWSEHQGEWTDEMTALAKVRRALIDA